MTNGIIAPSPGTLKILLLKIKWWSTTYVQPEMLVLGFYYATSLSVGLYPETGPSAVTDETD